MQTIERKMIADAISQVQRIGYAPICVYDGEVSQVGKAKVMTEAEVIEVCDSVDDSTIHFTNDRGRRAWIRVILGNGEDVLSDWSDVPQFTQALDLVIFGG